MSGKKITGYGILAAGISGVGIYRNFTFPKLPRLFQPASAVSPLMQKISKHVLPVSAMIGGVTALGTFLLLKKQDNALRKMFTAPNGFTKFFELIDIKEDQHNVGDYIITNKWLFGRNPIKALVNYLNNLSFSSRDENALLYDLVSASRQSLDQKKQVFSILILFELLKEEKRNAILENHKYQAERHAKIVDPFDKEFNLDEIKKDKKLKITFFAPNKWIGENIILENATKLPLFRLMLEQGLLRDAKFVRFQAWNRSRDKKYRLISDIYTKNSAVDFAVFIVEREKVKEFDRLIGDSSFNIDLLYGQSVIYPQPEKPYTLFIVELKKKESENEPYAVKKDDPNSTVDVS